LKVGLVIHAGPFIPVGLEKVGPSELLPGTRRVAHQKAPLSGIILISRLL
jgi:hypothetical protein